MNWWLHESSNLWVKSRIQLLTHYKTHLEKCHGRCLCVSSMWRRPIQQLFLNLSNVPAACDSIVGILGCRNLTTTNVEALPYLLVCCQRPTLKASQQETLCTRKSTRDLLPQGHPLIPLKLNPTALEAPYIATAHSIPLRITQTPPDNFSTSCILILENFLQSCLVSQLKIANLAKQNCSNSWVWSSPIKSTWPFTMYNHSYLLTVHFIPNQGAEASTSAPVEGGQVDDKGDKVMCLQLSPTALKFAKILTLLVLQGLVPMS